jgi:hypothetical protein
VSGINDVQELSDVNPQPGTGKRATSPQPEVAQIRKGWAGFVKFPRCDWKENLKRWHHS